MERAQFGKGKNAGNARHYKTPFKRVHTRIKARNKKLGFEDLITYEEMLPLMYIENCHYCSMKLDRVPHGQKCGSSTLLDRKDNDKGYILGNLLPCCWRCNNGKSNLFSYEEWFGMTEYLRNKI